MAAPCTLKDYESVSSEWSNFNKVNRQSAREKDSKQSHIWASPGKQDLYLGKQKSAPPHSLSDWDNSVTSPTRVTTIAPKLPNVNLSSSLPSNWTAATSSSSVVCPLCTPLIPHLSPCWKRLLNLFVRWPWRNHFRYPCLDILPTSSIAICVKDKV